MIRKSFATVLGLWVISFAVLAQTSSDQKENGPTFTPVENSYDFGIIAEEDGYADHIFKFNNTGNAPLVITNVSSSCGCTTPEWTKQPIEPGQEGFVILTYSTKSRLGHFTKNATVYTNETGLARHTLTISGEVVNRPVDAFVNYTDTVGGMGIEKNDLTFKTFKAQSINKISTRIKNYNNETVYLSWENVPDYVTIQMPDSLKAEWPGEIAFSIDGTKTTEKRGRITDKYKWNIKNSEGRVLGSEQFSLTVNYIDDFSKLTPLQTASAAALQIPNAIISFGDLKKNSSGLFSKTAYKPITLTNTGKSDLIIHSLTVDDERVQLPVLTGKTIKAGESLTVKATVKAKDFKSQDLDTDIYVVCNDPKGPVRRIKVTADKIN